MVLKKFKKKETIKKQKDTDQDVPKLASNSAAKSTSSSKPIKAFFKSLLLIGILGAIAGMTIGSYMLIKIMASTPELDQSKLYPTGSSLLRDKDGEVFADLGVQRSTWVSFDEIAPVMIDAIVATEDSRFFDHHGVDWSRFLAATWSNAANILTSNSGSTQGGSTLTQQLIKQTHLSSDREVNRKLQEIYLSIQLERVLSKEQIVEAYLNYSPFGGNIQGIQEAAQFYFGTDASNLTLAEASTLAGIVQLPNAWRPDHFADQTETRRDIVLKLMADHGYITTEMATLAAAQPITDKLVYLEPEIHDLDKVQPFIDAVLTEVSTRFELDPFEEGLDIYTTLDHDAQTFIHDLQNTNNMIIWPENLKSGIVFMETQTGKVRGIGGGAAEGERTFNYATQAERQIGSTAKPIFAYGAAIEYLGWGSGTILNDELFAYNDGTIINNYTREYHGRMTIREALNQSWNVPAVKAYNAVVEQEGQEQLAEFISNLGIETTAEQLLQSNALGTVEATPLQMAAAYAAFGNGGTYNEPMFIERIVRADGTVVYGEDNHVSQRAMSEETAYIMTDMLGTVMTQGTGVQANISNMYLSGKTGTTNIDADTRTQLGITDPNAMRDSWFIGYSSDYTASVWTGYSQTTGEDFITRQTQQLSWNTFNRIMANLNPAGTTRPTRPDTIVQRTVETISGDDGTALLASTSTPRAFTATELFISGQEPVTPSNRFQQLPAPQNFSGDVNGTTLSFSWDHVAGYTLSLANAQSAFNTANSRRQGVTQMTDALRSLDPTEAEARMMLRQIEAIGETVYTVYATTTNGNEVALETTTDNSITFTRSLGDLAGYTGFFVRASFERHTALASERSNIVSNSIESITVPPMTNWTQDQVEYWADENGITVSFDSAPSDTVGIGLVISTSPVGSIPVGGHLSVTLSTGPEESTETEPPSELDEPTEPTEPNEPIDNTTPPEEPDEPVDNIDPPPEEPDEPVDNITPPPEEPAAGDGEASTPRGIQGHALINENEFPYLAFVDRIKRFLN